MRQLAEIFFTFFRIGLFTFGGGYAMIALIQRNVIERKKWIDEKTFMELMIIAQSSPGPIAINTAVFVGYKHKGVAGAVAAALGTIIPSFVIILLIAIFFTSIRENRFIDAAFKGMRPAVVALIVGPIISLSRSMDWWKIVFAAFIGWALWHWGFSPIWILLAGGFIGVGATAYNAHKKIDKK